MGLYKYLKKTFRNKESLKPLIRERLIKWRKETAISRIEHPSNLIRAKELGYRAKPGFVLVRIRICSPWQAGWSLVSLIDIAL